MSVNAVLDKIVASNDGVIAALFSSEDNLRHNLTSPHDSIGAERLVENVTDVFELSESIDEDAFAFDDLTLGYDNHGVIARRVDGGVLVLLTEQMRRARARKLQVSLGLYAKSLMKELAKEAAAPVAPPVQLDMVAIENTDFAERGDAPLDRVDLSVPVDLAGTEVSTQAPRQRGGALTDGEPPITANRVPSRPWHEPEAEPQPTPQQAAPEEPKVDPNKGKRRRVYRGVVFYD